MPTEQRWMINGSCLGEDPEQWFPPPKDRRAALVAKMICRDCPVMKDCLRYALAHREDHGVWGGTTPGERDILLYGRRRPHRNWV